MTAKLMPRKPVDIRWILAGLLFFINPNVSVLDVLPDFVGAALVIAGFMHLAEIDERAKSAQKALMILAFVNGIRCLSLLLLTESDGTVWPLIFTFVFGAGEATLFIYGMLKLYAGITYQAMRRDCPAVYTGFTALNGLTALVAVLKGLLCFLPELTELTSDFGTVDSNSSGNVQISEFVYTVLTTINVVVVLLYSVGWWAYILKFFKTVGKSGNFLQKVEEIYFEEVGSKHQVLTYRALKDADKLFLVGLIFLFPLRLDGTDLLPDFVAAALLLLAVLRLKNLYPREGRRALILGGVYALLATGEWIGEMIFNSGMVIDYDSGYYTSVSTVLLRHPEKLTGYFILVGVSVFKYIVLALFLFMICRLFSPVISEHTGTAYELSGEMSAKKSKEIRRKLRAFRTALTVLSFFCAGAGIVHRLFRMFLDSMAVQYVEIAAVLVLLVAFLAFLSKLEEGIDNKYYMAK